MEQNLVGLVLNLRGTSCVHGATYAFNDILILSRVFMDAFVFFMKQICVGHCQQTYEGNELPKMK
jgi:hypothetical protein